MNTDGAYGGAMDSNPFGELLSENGAAPHARIAPPPQTRRISPLVSSCCARALTELKDVLDLETPQAAMTMAPEDDPHDSSLAANVPMPPGPFGHGAGAFGDFGLDGGMVHMEGGQQILCEDLAPSPWANMGAALLPQHGAASSLPYSGPAAPSGAGEFAVLPYQAVCTFESSYEGALTRS
jgi:hypothetical protein